MWLSVLSTGLRSKGWLVRFPVRAHAWVAGQVPSRGRARGNHTLMFLSLSPSLPLSLKISNKIFFLKKEAGCRRTLPGAPVDTSPSLVWDLWPVPYAPRALVSSAEESGCRRTHTSWGRLTLVSRPSSRHHLRKNFNAHGPFLRENNLKLYLLYNFSGKCIFF